MASMKPSMIFESRNPKYPSFNNRVMTRAPWFSCLFQTLITIMPTDCYSPMPHLKGKATHTVDRVQLGHMPCYSIPVNRVKTNSSHTPLTTVSRHSYYNLNPQSTWTWWKDVMNYRPAWIQLTCVTIMMLKTLNRHFFDRVWIWMEKGVQYK